MKSKNADEVGVSGAKPAACKSAGLAFVGSSPTSPTSRRAFSAAAGEAADREGNRRSLGEGGLACMISRARV